VRLVHISDSTTKNGVNQEAQFSKKKMSTPKQTGQTLLENWQRKSDARSCYDCLLPRHIAADCTTEKGQAAALRVIVEWLATTHEAVLPKHDMTLAQQCVPDTGRAVWTSVDKTRMFCPS
jgi:hypothetical protein